ncbi:hypothetical protein HSR122_1053 [Halapricum desulfuricans]|uniref:Uncharacterized protein n=1 Tax=Halapricum desulfuricans TaxID=2841257 RepID=A0A897NAR4_9EURY|nr:hypothetical protein HSR122_1053 [Halapricum desulfuricans]
MIARRVVRLCDVIGYFLRISEATVKNTVRKKTFSVDLDSFIINVS